MSRYLPRIIDSVLRADLSAFAGVLVTGARGVGKTRTALELANSTRLGGARTPGGSPPI